MPEQLLFNLMAATFCELGARMQIYPPPTEICRNIVLMGMSINPTLN